MNATQAPSTVFIVDDDEYVRKSLARLVGSAGWTAVPCESAEAFLDKAIEADHGCVLMDLRMPGMKGPDAHARMAELRIELPLIFLTGCGDIATSVQAMKRGAVDFLEKTVDPDLLLGSIQAALEKQAVAQGRDAECRDARECFGSLTAREREVLAGMLRGRLNKQIAGDLGISIKTVKVHRGRVMHKMQVRSVAQLVRLCEQAQLVHLCEQAQPGASPPSLARAAPSAGVATPVAG